MVEGVFVFDWNINKRSNVCPPDGLSKPPGSPRLLGRSNTLPRRLKHGATLFAGDGIERIKPAVVPGPMRRFNKPVSTSKNSTKYGCACSTSGETREQWFSQTSVIKALVVMARK